MRLLDLCLGLTEAWHLPIWVSQGYHLLLTEQRLLVKALRIAREDDPLRQQQLLDAEPSLRRWLNQPANTVLLANGLAMSAQESWTCPHTERWQYLTALYLQQPLSEVQQQVHQQAVISARATLMPDLWHPALSLIWPWNVQKIHRGLLPAPPPTAEALAVWRSRCTELLVEPSRFANAMHLTTCAKEALVASGMQRVLLFMADRALSTLRVHQAAGLPKDAANLSLDVVNSTLLQRLLEKSAQVRLTPGQPRAVLGPVAADPASPVQRRTPAVALTELQRPGGHADGGRPGRRAVLGNHRAGLRQNRAMHRESPAQLYQPQRADACATIAVLYRQHCAQETSHA